MESISGELLVFIFIFSWSDNQEKKEEKKKKKKKKKEEEEKEEKRRRRRKKKRISFPLKERFGPRNKY